MLKSCVRGGERPPNSNSGWLKRERKVFGLFEEGRPEIDDGEAHNFVCVGVTANNHTVIQFLRNRRCRLS